MAPNKRKSPPRGFAAIGVTGGIGAGKSLVLSYCARHYRCLCLEADAISKALLEPGEAGYAALVRRLGAAILDGEGQVDKRALADAIYARPALRLEVNGILHPLVEEHIRSRIAQARAGGEADFVLVEAALLLEAGYGAWLEEIWYVRASRQRRLERLAQGRQMEEKRALSIMDSQLGEADFALRCDWILENDGDMDALYGQIKHRLEAYPWRQ